MFFPTQTWALSNLGYQNPCLLLLVRYYNVIDLEGKKTNCHLMKLATEHLLSQTSLKVSEQTPFWKIYFMRKVGLNIGNLKSACLLKLANSLPGSLG